MLLKWLFTIWNTHSEHVSAGPHSTGKSTWLVILCLVCVLSHQKLANTTATQKICEIWWHGHKTTKGRKNQGRRESVWVNHGVRKRRKRRVYWHVRTASKWWWELVAASKSQSPSPLPSEHCTWDTSTCCHPTCAPAEWRGGCSPVDMCAPVCARDRDMLKLAANRTKLKCYLTLSIDLSHCSLSDSVCMYVYVTLHWYCTPCTLCPGVYVCCVCPTCRVQLVPLVGMGTVRYMNTSNTTDW